MLDVATTSDELTKPKQLTTGSFDEYNPLWVPDGARIYFTTTRIDEPYYELPTTDIYSVPAGGGAVQKLTTIPMGIGDVVLSPDGRRLAFHGEVTQPIRSYSQPDLWVMDLAPNAQPRNLTARYDFDMGSSVGGDNAAPRGGGGRGLYWSADGNTLFDMVTRQGRTLSSAWTRRPARSPRSRTAIRPCSTSPSRRMRDPWWRWSPPRCRSAICSASPPMAHRQRITDFNRKLWSQLNLTAAGRAHVHELRRQAHAGLDTEAAGLRPREEVPADP